MNVNRDKGIMKELKHNWLLVILPVLGISFWFLLAFPLADRNESYIWITYLEKYSFAEIIQHPIPSVRSLRPLAQALAWCLYHLSGGNGVLIQLVNFVLLCASVWIMIRLTPASKKTDARLMYLTIGFIYFPAFYYIFNLHGIFYSFMLLVIAFMLNAQERVLTSWKQWFAISLLLAFFHPLVSILYAAYLIGWIFEKQRTDRSRILLSVIILAALAIVVWSLLPFPVFSVIHVQNLVGTMNNVETYAIVKIFTLLLCLLTLANKTKLQRALLLMIIVLYVPTAIIYDVPVLLLLGLLIEISLVIEKKWSLAGLVAVAIFFSIAVGSGAPTKASIFIFLLPHLLLRPASPSFIHDFRIPKAISLATLAGVVVCAIFIRLEVKIPILSTLIRPLLVERGKTYQLDMALALAQQQTPKRRIRFLQEKHENIRDRGQPKERDNFPPAKQKEFDTYQDYKLSDQPVPTFPRWYLAFGTEISSDTLLLVRALHEQNCKPAYIYEPVPEPPRTLP